MKRKSWICVGIIITMLVVTVLLCACNKTKTDGTLNAPLVSMQGNVVVWDNVDGAESYTILINGNTYPVSMTFFDLSSLELPDGNVSIQVKANGKGKTKDSPYSSAFVYAYSAPKTEYSLQVVSEEGGTTNIAKRTYPANGVVELVAYPKEGYHFDGWYSNTYFRVCSDTTFTFTINTDTTLLAVFSRNAEMLDKTIYDDTELMYCPSDFALVVYCPEENAEEYIRENLQVYDDYYLDDEGNPYNQKNPADASIDYTYENEAKTILGTIENKGNNLYWINPQTRYEKSATYLAKANGNVTILKEYSRFVNSSYAAASDPIDYSALENDEGIEQLSFSIENTPHVNMVLNDNVYILAFRDNTNATDSNIDGWILERIGNGISDKEKDILGGFTTASITVRGDHELQAGDLVGFGGYITKDITLEQITENTVFGQIEKISVCGETNAFPIYFVSLTYIEGIGEQSAIDRVFNDLDVYKQGDVKIEEYMDSSNEELVNALVDAFYCNEESQKFFASVACAAESYANENNYQLVSATSILDNISIKPILNINGNTLTFGLNGTISIPFVNKNGRFGQANGELSVSFGFTESFNFEYEFAWVKKDVQIWFVQFQITSGINLKLVTTQNSKFFFDVAVKFTADTHTSFVLNESTKWIHIPSCYHIKAMNESNKKNSTDTLDSLERKGYTPCKDCIASTYVVNQSTKCIHRNGCWHIRQMLPANQKPSNLSLSELTSVGYWPCGTCLADAKQENIDLDATEGFRYKLANALNYENWGDKLKDIKTQLNNSGAGDTAKDILLCEVPFNCFVTIWLKVYATLSIKIEASVHYEQTTTNKTSYSIRAVIGDGFRTSSSREETAKSAELTLVGRIEIKAGVKLEVGISDPLCIIYVGVYGSVGAYVDLSGIAHISTTGTNYAGAYLEVGFYYDIGVSYRILGVFKGSASILSDKIPLLKMGHDIIAYAYENDIDEVILQASEEKRFFSLEELNLAKVKVLKLPSLSEDTMTIDTSSEEYTINIVFEKNQYFEIKDNKIHIMDNAPFDVIFDDTISISIKSKNTTWTTFEGTKAILYLPTIQVKIVCTNVCNEHAFVYMPAIDATCEATGLDECIVCTKCNKLFDIEGTKQLSERTVIPALGHEYETVEALAATCTTKGYKEYTICTRCGQYGKEIEYIEEGHIYPNETDPNKWEVEIAPTCEGMGRECERCVNCGVILAYKNILPLGHSFAQDNDDLDNVCTRCNKTLRDIKQDYINPIHTEHTFTSDPMERVESTCNVLGYTLTKCSYGECFVMDRKDEPLSTLKDHEDNDHNGICDQCGSTLGLKYDITDDYYVCLSTVTDSIIVPHYLYKIIDGVYVPKPVKLGDTCEISFDPNGGTCAITKTVVVVKSTYGEGTSGLLPIPIKEGYSFEWVDSKNNVINNDTVVINKRKHTLRAKWTPIDYNITLNVNSVATDGESLKFVPSCNASQTITFDSNTTLCVPSNTMSKHYQFLGWYKDEVKIANSDGTLVSSKWNISSDTVLCARWEKTHPNHMYIATASDFNNIRNNVSGKYYLVQDINLGEWNTPFGFCGEFNGGEYTITYSQDIVKKGIKKQSNGNDFTHYDGGLFNDIYDGALIEHLNVSCLVELNDNTYRTFSEDSCGRVGGLTGLMWANNDTLCPTIRNVSVSGNIVINNETIGEYYNDTGSGKPHGSGVGGIVGYAYCGTIDYCKSTVKVFLAEGPVGGIVGRVWMNDGDVTITNCTYAGGGTYNTTINRYYGNSSRTLTVCAVACLYGGSGGIIGYYNRNGKGHTFITKNLFVDSSVGRSTGGGTGGTGAIVGKAETWDYWTISNCYYTNRCGFAMDGNGGDFSNRGMFKTKSNMDKSNR